MESAWIHSLTANELRWLRLANVTTCNSRRHALRHRVTRFGGTVARRSLGDWRDSARDL